MEIPDVRFTTSADGTAIAYQATAPADRDIVFLPYITGLDVMWDQPTFLHVLERLCRLGRLICFDYRGMGASDPVALGGVPTPEAWMEDLRCVLDASGSRSAHIVANSTAGFIGMLFAATYPERTASLVLIDAFARLSLGDGQPFGPTAEDIERTVRAVESRWGVGASEILAPALAGDPAFRRWAGRFERYTMSRAAVGALMRWNWALDLRSVVPAIGVPTLVVSSNFEGASRLEHSRWLADQIAGARRVELSGSAAQFVFDHEQADHVLDATEEFITGAPPLREPDRALATVMFTDIVASTEQAARLGDARWTRLLDDHDAIVTRELERYRGRKVNPTGDGVLATFDGPARAVRCAQSICSSVGTLGIEVRAGLHAGEVELRGSDIGGIAVHIGQRISSLARPGEVLVSRTMTDLVAGSDLRFDERGHHELRGIPGTWEVYAVRP